MWMYGSCLVVPAARGGVRGCCCLIMASRTIDNIVTDDNMQLDKVIDNYVDIDNCSDPNPLTSGNINSLYHDIDTVCLHIIEKIQNLAACIYT